MCARTEAPISYRGAREKNAACKIYSAACKIYSPSRRMGKCKPQKIFSKPHFSRMTQINSWGRYNEVTRTLPLS